MTDNETNPQKIIDFLETLLTQLESQKVVAYFMSKPKATRERYLDYRFDVKLLIEKLTLARLKEIQHDINKHAPALIQISTELNLELKELESTRKILERLEKVFNLASRFALILL